jgi:hypothetical protein
MKRRQAWRLSSMKADFSHLAWKLLAKAHGNVAVPMLVRTLASVIPWAIRMLLPCWASSLEGQQAMLQFAQVCNSLKL